MAREVEEPGDAHTRMAAGGINASLGTRDANDSPLSTCR